MKCLDCKADHGMVFSQCAHCGKYTCMNCGSKMVEGQNMKDEKVFNKKVYIKQKGIEQFVLKQNNYPIPKGSYVRTWINMDGRPYKYEFRGKYQGYHNPEELIIVWK